MQTGAGLAFGICIGYYKLKTSKSTGKSNYIRYILFILFSTLSYFVATQTLEASMPQSFSMIRAGLTGAFLLTVSYTLIYGLSSVFIAALIVLWGGLSGILFSPVINTQYEIDPITALFYSLYGITRASGHEGLASNPLIYIVGYCLWQIPIAIALEWDAKKASRKVLLVISAVLVILLAVMSYVSFTNFTSPEPTVSYTQDQFKPYVSSLVPNSFTFRGGSINEANVYTAEFDVRGNKKEIWDELDASLQKKGLKMLHGESDDQMDFIMESVSSDIHVYFSQPDKNGITRVKISTSSIKNY